MRSCGTALFTCVKSEIKTLFIAPSAAVKNMASGLFFLNGDNESPESRSVIEKGVEWEYENENDKETLQTTGPLRHGILIMVHTKINFAAIRISLLSPPVM